MNREEYEKTVKKFANDFIIGTRTLSSQSLRKYFTFGVKQFFKTHAVQPSLFNDVLMAEYNFHVISYYLGAVDKEALDFTKFKNFLSNIGVNVGNSEISIHLGGLFNIFKVMELKKKLKGVKRLKASDINSNPLFNKKFLQYVPKPSASEKLIDFHKQYKQQTILSREHISDVVTTGGLVLAKEMMNTKAHYRNADELCREIKDWNLYDSKAYQWTERSLKEHFSYFSSSQTKSQFKLYGRVVKSVNNTICFAMSDKDERVVQAEKERLREFYQDFLRNNEKYLVPFELYEVNLNNKVFGVEKTYFCPICDRDKNIIMMDRYEYLAHLYSTEQDNCVLHITMRNFLKDAYNITKSSLLDKVITAEQSKVLVEGKSLEKVNISKSQEDVRAIAASSWNKVAASSSSVAWPRQKQSNETQSSWSSKGEEAVSVDQTYKYKLDYQMDLEQGDLLELYERVPLIKASYRNDLFLKMFYAEASLAAWKIGRLVIAKARMTVQNYVTTQFSREALGEMKNVKDFITFILENDWFFDIGYKISVCQVKPHHSLYGWNF